MVVPRRDGPSSLAVVGLLAANLLPLAGVLWWGWSAFELLVVYWLESGIVGLLNVPKILLASGEDEPVENERSEDASGDGDSTVVVQIGSRTYRPGADGSALERGGTAAFFAVHYGIFWVVHGVFVFTLPLFAGGTGWYGDLSVATVGLAVGSLAASHGLSFLVNYLGREEYRRVTPGQQMFQPYGRVFALHLTIVFGAYVVALVGTPLAALLLLVALKTAIDVGAHLREHGSAERTPVPLPFP